MNIGWVFVIAGSIGIGLAGGWWLCASRILPDDEKRVHAQVVAVNAQGRYENYKARCIYLEKLVERLNKELDRTKRELGLLGSENQDMADLLHDYISVNSCDLHKSQAFLAVRVQYLKACGFGISEIQKRIFGSIGGAYYYKVKRFFDGDMSMHPLTRNDHGSEYVELCACHEADRKAEQAV